MSDNLLQANLPKMPPIEFQKTSIDWQPVAENHIMEKAQHSSVIN